MTAKLSEQLAIVGTIDPEARTATGTALTDAIDMSKFEQVAFVILTNTIGATDTVDLKLTECATSGGTYTDITGKAITQLDNADDDAQAVINLRASELTPGYRYVKAKLTHGGTAATCEVCVVAIAGDARFGPASDDDLASVAEIVG